MIPGFPQVGGGELLILLAIVLLFFGAKRIPVLARSLGSGVREFRQAIGGAGDDTDEVQDHKEQKNEEKPSPDRAAQDEMPGAEQAGTTRAEEKA